MAFKFRPIRAGLRLMYKVRHHRGHGIHSPFVFNLINKVIEEKTPYYAYEKIQQYLNIGLNYSRRQTKYNRLCFRLVNYFNATRLLELGATNGINTLFITAPSSAVECISIEQCEFKKAQATKLYANWDRRIMLHTTQFSDIDSKLDCVFINLNCYKGLNTTQLSHLWSLLHEKSFVVIHGIRTNKKNYSLWKDVIANENRTAVLDLFNIGIIFFDKSLYRWKYRISF